MKASKHMIPNPVTKEDIHGIKVMLRTRSWKIISIMLQNQAATLLLEMPSESNQIKATTLLTVANLDRDAVDDIMDRKSCYAPDIRGEPVPEVQLGTSEVAVEHSRSR